MMLSRDWRWHVPCRCRHGCKLRGNRVGSECRFASFPFCSHYYLTFKRATAYIGCPAISVDSNEIEKANRPCKPRITTKVVLFCLKVIWPVTIFVLDRGRTNHVSLNQILTLELNLQSLLAVVTTYTHHIILHYIEAIYSGLNKTTLQGPLWR